MCVLADLYADGVNHCQISPPSWRLDFCQWSDPKQTRLIEISRSIVVLIKGIRTVSHSILPSPHSVMEAGSWYASSSSSNFSFPKQFFRTNFLPIARINKFEDLFSSAHSLDERLRYFERWLLCATNQGYTHSGLEISRLYHDADAESNQAFWESRLGNQPLGVCSFLHHLSTYLAEVVPKKGTVADDLGHLNSLRCSGAITWNGLREQHPHQYTCIFCLPLCSSLPLASLFILERIPNHKTSFDK